MLCVARVVCGAQVLVIAFGAFRFPFNDAALPIHTAGRASAIGYRAFDEVTTHAIAQIAAVIFCAGVSVVALTFHTGSMNNLPLHTCVFGAGVIVIHGNGISLDAKTADTTVADGTIVPIEVTFGFIWKYANQALGHIEFRTGTDRLFAGFIGAAVLGRALATQAVRRAIVAFAGPTGV